MRLRKYALYTYLSIDEKPVTEREFVRRFWTRRGAERYGKLITRNPDTLVASLESVMKGGRMIFPEYLVINEVAA